MRNLSRQTHFRPQLIEPRADHISPFGKKLERHRRVENEIVGAVDLIHAPLTQFGHDPIPVEQQTTRCETLRGGTRWRSWGPTSSDA